MTISQALRNELCQKLRGVGLSKEVTLPLIDTITKQVNAEGPENVVKRLKVLKQAAINVLAGGDATFPWISHTNGAPKGPWKPVWKMLEHSSHKHRKRAFNALMVYASLVLPKRACPTAAQERKFLSSVEHSSVEAQVRNERAESLSQTKEWRRSEYALLSMLGTAGWTSKLSEAPDAISYILRKKGVEGDARAVTYAERQLLTFLGTDAGREFHPFPSVLATLGSVGQDYFDLVHPYHNAYGDWRESVPSTEPVGVIGSTQEPGMKFRAFASPNLILQAALEPLKVNLLSAVSRLPFDCTHDQGKGIVKVQEWLHRSNTVFAVDLSDATNNFPLGLQTSLLRRIGIDESHVRLLELVSRSPYKLMWGERKLVSWDIGQPLGAGPSFPAFALAHSCLAICAGLKAGLPLDEIQDSFLVLGDDFVTKSEGLHREYRKLLKELSCPISEQKCLESRIASEFAGKLIFANSVYHGYKYSTASDVSFLDVVRTLGPQAISEHFLTRDQVAVCKLVQDIPEPFGLGFNPKGLKYEVRYEKYLWLKNELSKKDKPLEYVSLASLYNKFAHLARTPDLWNYFQADTRQFQETEARLGYGQRMGTEKDLFGVRQGVLLSMFIEKGDPRAKPPLVKARELKAISDLVDRRMVTSAVSVALTATPLISRVGLALREPGVTKRDVLSLQALYTLSSEHVRALLKLNQTNSFTPGSSISRFATHYLDLHSTVGRTMVTSVTPSLH